MGDVVNFTGLTTVDMPPNEVLEHAKGAEFGQVVVVGIDGDGDIRWYGSTSVSKDILWLLTWATYELMEKSE